MSEEKRPVPVTATLGHESQTAVDPVLQKRDSLVAAYMSGAQNWQQISESLGADFGMMTAVSKEIRVKTKDRLVSEYLSGEKNWQQISEGLGEDFDMMIAVGEEIRSRQSKVGEK